MSAQPTPYLLPEDYLNQERQALRKSEYYRGEVFALAGASREHNLLASNSLAGLGTRLRETCNIFPSDMRVHVPAAGLYTYPDVSVVCGPEDYLPGGDLDTLLNPTLLVEVLSPSTAGYDRHSKFLLYRTIPSLRYYLLVESRRVEVLLYARASAGQWTFTSFEDRAAVVPLPALGLELPLADIYRKLALAPSEPPAG